MPVRKKKITTTVGTTAAIAVVVTAAALAYHISQQAKPRIDNHAESDRGKRFLQYCLDFNKGQTQQNFDIDKQGHLVQALGPNSLKAVLDDWAWAALRKGGNDWVLGFVHGYIDARYTHYILVPMGPAATNYWIAVGKRPEPEVQAAVQRLQKSQKLIQEYLRDLTELMAKVPPDSLPICRSYIHLYMLNVISKQMALDKETLPPACVKLYEDLNNIFSVMPSECRELIHGLRIKMWYSSHHDERETAIITVSSTSLVDACNSVIMSAFPTPASVIVQLSLKWAYLLFEGNSSHWKFADTINVAQLIDRLIHTCSTGSIYNIP